jgi:hypothetical protein
MPYTSRRHGMRAAAGKWGNEIEAPAALAGMSRFWLAVGQGIKAHIQETAAD